MVSPARFVPNLKSQTPIGRQILARLKVKTISGVFARFATRGRLREGYSAEAVLAREGALDFIFSMESFPSLFPSLL